MGQKIFKRGISMENCPVCGESLTYVKTVRSRQLKKRWNIFKCKKCNKEIREVR